MVETMKHNFCMIDYYNTYNAFEIEEIINKNVEVLWNFPTYFSKSKN